MCSLSQSFLPGQTLLFIAYDGTEFSGSAWQPSEPTVQGELYYALRKVGLVETPFDFRLVSRTDKGVHALFNTAVCSFSRTPPLNAINMVLSRSSRVWVWGYAHLEKEVTLLSKEYAYYFPIALIPPQLMGSSSVKDFVQNLCERMTHFIGTHDFSAFIRRDKVERETVHTIYSINVQLVPPWITLKFRGDGFGWEQIRRIVGFVFDPRWLSINIESLFTHGSSGPLSIKPAPPDFLILERMSFDSDISDYSLKEYFKGKKRFLRKSYHLLLRHNLMKEFFLP